MRNTNRRRLLLALAGALAAMRAPSSVAQTFPTRAITLVAPFAAGAAPDSVVRALAHEIAKEVGKPVVVDNKPGASSIIAAQMVAKAAPDGYTLLVSGNVPFTANPHTFRRLPYDPDRDFEPITALAKGAMFLYVNPRTVAARTAVELIRSARQQPGRFTFGYTSATSRMPAELLQQAGGIQLVGVPYKAGSQALPDLLAGRIDMLFTDFSAWPYVRDGRLIALAVTDIRRSPLAPATPTLDESGVKGLELTYWLAAYAPARTPAEIVHRLHALFSKACQSPAVQTAMASGGTTVFLTAPGELRRFQAQEAEKWGRIIRAAGMEPE